MAPGREWIMDKVLSESFIVGNVHVRLMRFTQYDLMLKIQDYCNSYIEGIYRLWDLDHSQKKVLVITPTLTLFSMICSASNISRLIVIILLFTFSIVLSILGYHFYYWSVILVLSVVWLIIFFRKIATEFNKSDRGNTTLGCTKQKINIYRSALINDCILEETVIHELCHALCSDLPVSRHTFPFDEGMALLTSHILTGKKLFSIEEKYLDEYFFMHEEYFRSKIIEHKYTRSYWMIRYLIRDEVNISIFLGLIRDKGRLKLYKGKLLEDLNENTFQYFRNREDRYKIKPNFSLSISTSDVRGHY
jgi:hypothetical protein